MQNETRSITRRSFLRGSAFAALAAGWSPRSWAQAAGANSDIRVAVVGFGGRGGSHIEAFSEMAGTRVVALCDCDQKILDNGAKKLAEIFLNRPASTIAANWGSTWRGVA